MRLCTALGYALQCLIIYKLKMHTNHSTRVCSLSTTPQAFWVTMAGDGDWSTGVGLHTGVSPDAQMRMKQGLARLQKGEACAGESVVVDEPQSER
jgi:hypothetical protein